MVKRLIIMILVSIVLISAVAYASEAKARSEVKNDTAFEEKDIPVMAPDASDVNEDQDPEPIDQKAKDYEWNASRTYMVGEITFHNWPEGHYNTGHGSDELPIIGIKSQKIGCDTRGVYAYYNYDRLVDTALADGAIYSYYDIDGFESIRGTEVDERHKNDPPGLFYDGTLTEEFIKKLNDRGTGAEYTFYINWLYQDKAEIGDVILVALDPQVTINLNYLNPGSNIKYPKRYDAVVVPYTPDDSEPYIAHFIDGKLQLPAELEDAFALRRLYDDTDPELTGIKDGDAIEDVVAFLKAVEQDMIRYEEEMRQQPITTDVSSIQQRQ